MCSISLCHKVHCTTSEEHITSCFLRNISPVDYTASSVVPFLFSPTLQATNWILKVIASFCHLQIKECYIPLQISISLAWPRQSSSQSTDTGWAYFYIMMLMYCVRYWKSTNKLKCRWEDRGCTQFQEIKDKCQTSNTDNKINVCQNCLPWPTFPSPLEVPASCLFLRANSLESLTNLALFMSIAKFKGFFLIRLFQETW